MTIKSNDICIKRINNTLFTRALLCSLCVSAFNFLLCLFDYLSWYQNGWSEEKLVTLLDLVLKTVAWCFVSLERKLLSSSEIRLAMPLFFRAWCVSYLFVSFYIFTVDIFLYEKKDSLPIQYLVSDVFSVCVGLLICYFCFLEKNEG